MRCYNYAHRNYNRPNGLISRPCMFISSRARVVSVPLIAQRAISKYIIPACLPHICAVPVDLVCKYHRY